MLDIDPINALAEWFESQGLEPADAMTPRAAMRAFIKKKLGPQPERYSGVRRYLYMAAAPRWRVFPTIWVGEEMAAARAIPR